MVRSSSFAVRGSQFTVRSSWFAVRGSQFTVRVRSGGRWQVGGLVRDWSPALQPVWRPALQRGRWVGKFAASETSVASCAK